MQQVAITMTVTVTVLFDMYMMILIIKSTVIKVSHGELGMCMVRFFSWNVYLVQLDAMQHA